MTDRPAVPRDDPADGNPPSAATGDPATPPPVGAGDPDQPPPYPGGPGEPSGDTPRHHTPPGPSSGGAGFTSRYGLVRPRQGRYLAGVCVAIGRATNTDPVLWRVLLAVLGFFGGIGILVYLAAWLIIPAEGDSASPVEAMLGRGRSSMSPITVLVLGVLVAVLFGLIVTDKFRAVLLGAAILIVGALLLNRNGGQAGSPPDVAGPSGTAGRPGPGQPGWPAPAPAPSVQPAGHGYSSAPVAGFDAPVSGQPGQDSPPYTAGSTPTVPYPATQVPFPAGPGYPAATPHSEPSGGYGSPAWPAPPAPATGFAGSRPLGPTLDRGYRPAFAPHGPYAGTPAPHRYPPAPAPVKPPKPPRERSPLGAATFSLIFVAIGVVAVLDLLNAVPVEPSTYFFAALVTIAVGLLVGTWLGRARWLIALGLVAAAALGITTMAQSYNDADTHDGRVNWRPTSYDQVANGYQNQFGDATLDLREVDFTGQDRQIMVKVGFGSLRVLLPPTVDTTVSTHLNAGEARVFQDRWSGVDTSTRDVVNLGPDGQGGGKIRLDLRVDAGDVEVSR